MNEKLASDWNDLAKLWQAEAAAVSVDDIDAHLKRHRRHMRMVTLAELAGVGLGVVAAGWLALVLPYRWLGLVVAVFVLVFAVVVVRMRRELPPSGSVDVLQSLKDSLVREDWIAEQLRFGRALSFVALFAILMATGSQLRQFSPTFGARVDGGWRRRRLRDRRAGVEPGAGAALAHSSPTSGIFEGQVETMNIGCLTSCHHYDTCHRLDHICRGDH